MAAIEKPKSSQQEIHGSETLTKMWRVASNMRLVAAMHDLALSSSYVDAEAQRDYPGTPVTAEIKSKIRDSIKNHAKRAEKELLGIDPENPVAEYSV